MAKLGDEEWERGVTLYDEGELNEAASVWREGLRLNPAHTDLHYNLGVALYESDHVEEAVSEWRETVRLNPDFHQTYERLGSTFWRLYHQHKKRSDLQASREAYRQAATIQPDNADILRFLGRLEWKLGNRGDAITTLQRAIKADPTSVVAHETLIWCQLHVGQWSAAWQTISKLMELPGFDAVRYQVNFRFLFLRLAFPAMALGSITLVGRKVIRKDRR